MIRATALLLGFLAVALGVGNAASIEARAQGADSRPVQVLVLRVESHVHDVDVGALTSFVSATLNDHRGWSRAGLRFEFSSTATYRLILAEPGEVDRLCAPLGTNSQYSCQNGPIVAFNADRWRRATDDWDADLSVYRQYMVNHEVGHLFGQRHPKPRCPHRGGRAAVMEQQSKGLAGCKGNAWPLDWEVDRAAVGALTLAPPADWQPKPDPVNRGDEPSASILPEAEPLATDQTTMSSSVPNAPDARPVVESKTAITISPFFPPSSSTVVSPGRVREPSQLPAVRHRQTGDGFRGWMELLGGGLLVVGFGSLGWRRRRRRGASRNRPAPPLPVRIRGATYGMPEFTRLERLGDTTVGVLLMPPSNMVPDDALIQRETRSLMDRVLDSLPSGAAFGGDTVAANVAALRDRGLGVGVIVACAGDGWFCTTPGVRLGTDGLSGRRNLLPVTPGFGALSDPGDEVFVLAGGSARSMLADSKPLPVLDEPGVAERLLELAARNQSHPFVVVGRSSGP